MRLLLTLYGKGISVLLVVRGIVALCKGGIFEIEGIGRWLLGRQGVACGGQLLFVPVQHFVITKNPSFPIGNYLTPIITYTFGEIGH